MRISFDQDWRFYLGDCSGAWERETCEEGWEHIRLPHDYSIHQEFDENCPGGKRNAFLPGNIGWYRKHFTMRKEWEGRCLGLEFEGVFHNAQIWLNGVYLGDHPYGFTGFFFDITDIAVEGDNVLAVKTDTTKQPSTRWYAGSGIYRHVWLTVKEKVFISRHGIKITSCIVDGQAQLFVRTQIENVGSDRELSGILLTTSLWRQNSMVVRKQAEVILDRGLIVVEQILRDRQALIWSPEAPGLYEVKVRLWKGDHILDEAVIPYGVREAVFDKEKGFVLNGEQVKLRGVNLHQDGGCIGAAVSAPVMERRLACLKEMGCNAVRWSHNPPAEEFLALCDRMGFLVIDEAFDKWDDWGYYSIVFDKWWEKDLDEMILRDRNHACVILWSVGNEAVNQCSEHMMETLKMLTRHVHGKDPERPVTYAIKPMDNSTAPEEDDVRGVSEEERFWRKIEHFTEIGKITDVMCCNYQEQWFPILKKYNPDIVVIGSESYGYFRGREMQYKAYEPIPPVLAAEESDYVAGCFLWSGIDYLGESEGWPCVGWASAPIDSCGFKRPFFYYYQSVWTTKPMVHVSVYDENKKGNPEKLHWSWPSLSDSWEFPNRKGRLVRVAVFTNCEEAELVLNGVSQGRKAQKKFGDRILLWYLPYEPGKLEAVGLHEGKEQCRYSLMTPGESRQLRLIPDKEVLYGNGNDILHLVIEETDERGTLCTHGEHLVSVILEGPGELLGLGSGNLCDHRGYDSHSRNMFEGRCLAIVRSGQKEGNLKICVTAEGMEKRELTIKVKKVF